MAKLAKVGLLVALTASAEAQDGMRAGFAARSYEAAIQSVSTAPRRRIVDPKKFPPRRNPVLRGIQAPFRWLGEKSEAGMARFENDRLLERGMALLGVEVLPSPDHKHLHHSLFFGTTSENSGFGVGGSVSTADLISPDFQFKAVAAFTTKKYFDSGVGFSFDPLGQGFNNLSIDVLGRYAERTQEEFSGAGPSSFRGDLSTYEVQERGVSAIATVSPGRRFSFGGGLDVSSSSAGNGGADDIPSTLRVFTPGELPGAGGVQLLSPLAFVVFDARDSAGNPRKGAFARFGYRHNRTLGGSEFDHDEYSVDLRGYIPLGTRRRIVALRVAAEFNDPRRGAQVPFFLLARLGGSGVLRGYDPQRFYGRNALVSSMEYRFDMTRHLGTFVFTDVGQVFDEWEQLTGDNLRGTFGGGFEVKSGKSVFARIFAARTSEATRLMVRLGAGF